MLASGGPAAAAARDVRATTWPELEELLHEEIRASGTGRYHSHLAYRGVARADWTTRTSLQRLGGPYAQVERHLLKDFRRYAHGRDFETAGDWDVLTVGQHFGLPTRLLDWTYSPLVALHFATAEAAHADADAAVWVVDYAALNRAAPAPLAPALAAAGGNSFTTVALSAAGGLDAFARLSPEPFVVMFEPPSMDARVVNQYAALSVANAADADVEALLTAHAPALARRVVFDPDVKAVARERLDQANITERVLFPGLDGLSRSLARYYSPAAGRARRAAHDQAGTDRPF